MKAKFLFLSALIISALSCFALAQEVSVKRIIYVPGETVQAEVSYDDFDTNKLSLLENENKISVAFHSLELEDSRYFVYFNLPNTITEGNYTLQLKDRKVVEGELTDLTGEAGFKVVEGDSSFTIKPAIVKLDPEKTSLKIELEHSKGDAVEINISVTGSAVKPARETMTLDPGYSRLLFADYQHDEMAGDAMLRLDFEDRYYEIPLLVTPEEPEPNVTVENITEERPDLSEAIKIVGFPEKVKHTAAQNATIEGTIKFTNAYSEPLHDIVFSASPEIKDLVEFNISSFATAMPNGTYEQYIWINKKRDIMPGSYSGSITISSAEGATKSISMDLVFEDLIEGPVVVQEPEKAEPGLNITEYELNVSINYSELQAEQEEERAESLKIALLLILFVVIVAVLLAYRLRPKKISKKLEEYVAELKAPKKKK